MNTMHSIRTTVFKVSQQEMAEIAGVSQGTISRWEDGSIKPTLSRLLRIRNEAKRRSVEWNDALFFEAGVSAERAA